MAMIIKGDLRFESSAQALAAVMRRTKPAMRLDPDQRNLSGGKYFLIRLMFAARRYKNCASQ
jgi:hypothetical protein